MRKPVTRGLCLSVQHETPGSKTSSISGMGVLASPCGDTPVAGSIPVEEIRMMTHLKGQKLYRGPPFRVDVDRC